MKSFPKMFFVLVCLCICTNFFTGCSNLKNEVRENEPVNNSQENKAKKQSSLPLPEIIPYNELDVVEEWKEKTINIDAPFYDESYNRLILPDRNVSGYELNGSDVIFFTDKTPYTIHDGARKIISVWNANGVKATYKVENEIYSKDKVSRIDGNPIELVMTTSQVNYTRGMSLGNPTVPTIFLESIFPVDKKYDDIIVNCTGISQDIIVNGSGTGCSGIIVGSGKNTLENISGDVYLGANEDIFHWSGGSTHLYNYSKNQDKINMGERQLDYYVFDGNDVMFVTKTGGILVVKDTTPNEIDLYRKKESFIDWYKYLERRRHLKDYHKKS